MCHKLYHFIWGIWWFHRSKDFEAMIQESWPFGLNPAQISIPVPWKSSTVGILYNLVHHPPNGSWYCLRGFVVKPRDIYQKSSTIKLFGPVLFRTISIGQTTAKGSADNPLYVVQAITQIQTFFIFWFEMSKKVSNAVREDVWFVVKPRDIYQQSST